MEKNKDSRSPRFLLWSLISVGIALVVTAAAYVIEFVPLVYPPMPPLPPGQEAVLDPAWKITLHHDISLRLNPPPPLTGAD
jgi:hypothetical protein